MEKLTYNLSLSAHIKVTLVKLVQEDAMLVPRYAVTATYRNRERKMQKRFAAFWKKRARQTQFHKNNFRKVVVYNLIPDALRDLHTSKYKKNSQ